ncbi:hypothetical protein FRX31_025227, partial [Thalictrum thalictroides]
HLELVSGLTSDAFIAALTRFIARRGPCLHLHSDNGTNFVGANRELSSYFKAEAGKQNVTENMAQRGVTWHFNPPSAPHEDNVPPLQWRLGRVLIVHPGNDDVVRAVTVRMGNGNVYKRPVVKLALLPTATDEEEEHQLQQQ